MDSETQFHIRSVRSATDLIAVTQLFRNYAASLSVDLSYQNFAEEFVSLPGAYTSPFGDLLLGVRHDGRALGCVAVRRLSEGEAEMKRLYVAPRARGMGLGKALGLAIIKRARDLGYSAIKLDTLPEMMAAQRLYVTLGFSLTEPYYDTPIEGTAFMRRDL